MLTLPTTAQPPVTKPQADAAALFQLLTDLYQKQFAQMPDSAYLRTHADPRAIVSHVQNFLWYERMLPPAGAVLDWGCNHAPDSCLLRARFGDRFELHGCDFRPAADFAPFFEYASVSYKPIKGVVTLPYTDKTFDVVIGSGTLEHTAMDYESLKELYRILKIHGVLIITYLPNCWSIQEWARRTFSQPAHRRLYGVGELKQLLKRTGFYPIAVDHQMWDGVPRVLAQVLRRTLPFHLFSSTLRVVAKKMRIM